MSDRLVYVKSQHSKLHIAVLHDGAMLSNERCQLDDMDETRHTFDEMPEVDARDFCHRCFPPNDIHDDAETVTLA